MEEAVGLSFRSSGRGIPRMGGLGVGNGGQGSGKSTG